MFATVPVVLVFSRLSSARSPAFRFDEGMMGLWHREAEPVCRAQNGTPLSLETAPITSCKNEWFCSTRTTPNVWTRMKCRTHDARNPSCLFRFHKLAVEEPQFVRHEASSGEESLGTVVVQYRIAVGRIRREKELEANIAKLEAELTGGNADSKASKTSGICGQGDADREEPVPVETTPEADRNAV